MNEIDRQVNDLLEVKIYKLENADPDADGDHPPGALPAPGNRDLERRALGRRRQHRTSSAGPGWPWPARAAADRGGGGGGALLPSQEVEITSDVRTRSVIAKASKEYIAIIDDVVKKLDQDPTETVSTYVIRCATPTPRTSR
jgi:hypothetical protein